MLQHGSTGIQQAYDKHAHLAMRWHHDWQACDTLAQATTLWDGNMAGTQTSTWVKAYPDLYIAVLGLADAGTGASMQPHCSLGTQHALKQVSRGFHVVALAHGKCEIRHTQAANSCQRA